jgi:hypothetical protein
VKKQAALAAPLIKKADAVLAQLGFEPVPAAAVKKREGDVPSIVAPDGRKIVFSEKDPTQLVAGSAKKELAWDRPPDLVAFVPKAVVATLRTKGRVTCDDGMYWWTVDVTPTP